jgi:hypothetical protein
MLRYFVPVFCAAFALCGNLVLAAPPDQILYTIESDVKLVGGSSGLLNPAEQRAFPQIGIYAVGSPPILGTESAKLFPDVQLSTSDVGSPITASAVTPEFSTFASLVTNGQNQFVSIPTGPSIYIAKNESAWFQDASPAVDLQGFTLNRLTYTIIDWYYDSPGRDPNHNGFWTDTYFGYRVTFEGYAIPEPGTISLAICAFGLLLTHRGKRLS